MTHRTSVGDLFDLSGKVTLVTGGSRGLGREMVRAFAAAGADVVIASRKLDACEALVACRSPVRRRTARTSRDSSPSLVPSTGPVVMPRS